MTGRETTTTAVTKKGGNFGKDLANLSVPFGLILAQKSLEKYLSMKTPSKATTKKSAPSNKQSAATPVAKPAKKKTEKTAKSRKTVA